MSSSVALRHPCGEREPIVGPQTDAQIQARRASRLREVVDLVVARALVKHIRAREPAPAATEDALVERTHVEGMARHARQAIARRRGIAEEIRLVLAEIALDLGVEVGVVGVDPPAFPGQPDGLELKTLHPRLTQIGGEAGDEQLSIHPRDRPGFGELLVRPVDVENSAVLKRKR